MTPRARAAALHPAATPRFAAALCFSALVHVSLPVVVSGGGSRSAGTPPGTPVLNVRIVPPLEPHPAGPVDAAPQVEPTKEPPRLRSERVEEAEAVAGAEAAPTPPPTQPQPGRAPGTVPEALDPTYYAAKQLDVFPALATALDLEYRGKAAAEGVTGRALILVLIDEIGAVNDVSVVESQPADYFEDEVTRAFMAARFTPGYRNGRAVRSRVLIEVNYGAERGSP